MGKTINYSVTVRQNPTRPEIKKCYANMQLSGTISTKELAVHMETHGSQYDRGDIYAILMKVTKCVRELLIEGYKVELGDLGHFYPSINSEGADDPEKFTEQNIKGINARWTPGKDFENLISDAAFQPVATRKKQAEALKQEKDSAMEEINNA